MTRLAAGEDAGEDYAALLELAGGRGVGSGDVEEVIGPVWGAAAALPAAEAEAFVAATAAAFERTGRAALADGCVALLRALHARSPAAAAAVPSSAARLHGALQPRLSAAPWLASCQQRVYALELEVACAAAGLGAALEAPGSPRAPAVPDELVDLLDKAEAAHDYHRAHSGVANLARAAALLRPADQLALRLASAERAAAHADPARALAGFAEALAVEANAPAAQRRALAAGLAAAASGLGGAAGRAGTVQRRTLDDLCSLCRAARFHGLSTDAAADASGLLTQLEKCIFSAGGGVAVEVQEVAVTALGLLARVSASAAPSEPLRLRVRRAWLPTAEVRKMRSWPRSWANFSL